MWDTIAWTATLVCLLGGVMFILFPQRLLNVSQSFNRTLLLLDERLMRYRYLLGALMLILSYSFFRLALLLTFHE